MPAKIKAWQALKFAQAPVRGEPCRSKIVMANLHDSLRERNV
jgi:hypothetical protein